MKTSLRMLAAAAALLAAMGCKEDKTSAPAANAAGAAPAAQTAKAGAPAPAAVAASATAVPVEMFVMSQCPYGVQALDGMIPAVRQLGNEVDLHIDYIGTNNGGTLTSMHGPKEVTGDIAQLCAHTIAPGALLDFISCQNKNMRQVDTNWEPCAASTGIDATAMKSCVTGDQGKSLLSASFDRAAKKGARGSPTIYIGGQSYRGKRTPDAFIRSICKAHKNPSAVPVCAAIPEAKPVNFTILSDKACGADCERSVMQANHILKNNVEKPVITEMDYSTPEGKALYEKIGGEGMLPMVILDKTINDDKDALDNFKRGLRPTKDAELQILMLRASWDPICMAEGGCQIERCKETMACRPETPNTLELFVMSQCPYGVKALNAMEEVLKNFGGKLNFSVHFIGSGDAKNLSSMHGKGEVDEDIRELCAMKHYAQDYKFMDYVLCRNKNIRNVNAWDSCTGANGIDKSVIQSCFDGDGKQLLADDFKIADRLNIGGSPTWVVNGRNKFSGLDAETVRANVCKYNPGLEGCGNKLSGDSGAPVQGGCGN